MKKTTYIWKIYFRLLQYKQLQNNILQSVSNNCCGNIFISWLGHNTYIVDPKLLNFDEIIQKLHGSMEHSIKQTYSSYNSSSCSSSSSSSGSLIWV